MKEESYCYIRGSRISQSEKLARSERFRQIVARSAIRQRLREEDETRVLDLAEAQRKERVARAKKRKAELTVKSRKQRSATQSEPLDDSDSMTSSYENLDSYEASLNLLEAKRRRLPARTEGNDNADGT